MTTCADITDTLEAEHYLVSHGKCGGLGNFAASGSCTLRRGDRVVIEGPRGREVGTVLRQANVRQSRLLGVALSGAIVRLLSQDDELDLRQQHALQERLFAAASQLARSRDLPIEILDVDVLLENRAIIQFLGVDDAALEAFADHLGRDFGVEIHLENLALATVAEEPAGCGKPDCGKTDGGGCTTCSTGGGCSSCGSEATDLSPYFAHLRTKMENNQRTPLL